MHTVYTGERVRLRPFRDKDEWSGLWDELHGEANEYWGAWWMTHGRREKDFDPAGMLQPGKYSHFAIDRVDTGELVGYLEHGGKGPGHVYNWVGTFIKQEHWHKGFGIEAKQLCYCYLFENYPLVRVDTATLQHHVRARQGLVASGMHYEGAIRGYHWCRGRYHDLVCYVIFRDQWERLPVRSVVERG